MKLVKLKCKIYADLESEFSDEYRISSIHIDLDMVGAYHAAEDSSCTIIYSQGVAHEILMSVKDFTTLKIGNDYNINKNFISIFSDN